MANVIRIKRRATGSAGAPSSLANAEVAFNEVDNTLYYGKGGTSSTADTIIPIAGPGAFVDLTSNQTVNGDKTFVATVNLNSLQLSGVAVTASATDLNKLAGVTAGTASASKALVVDANKDLNLAGGDLTVQDLVVNGDLTVNGTETILNTQTLEVEDKNIEMGVVATPTDASADGGGIILKGTTDKSIVWYDASDAWTSSEHLNLASGKKFQINGTDVLTSSALGSGVTSSSLTSVGTISSGTWQGSAVGIAYGGTGQTTAQAAINALTQASGGSNGQVLTRNSSGNAVWETPADSGISSLNGLTVDAQTFAIGTDATQEVPYWSSSGSVHTLNLPYATNAVRGLVSNQNQLFGGRKAFLDGATVGEGSGIGGTFDVYNTGSAPAVLIKKANGATGEAIKFIDHTGASVFVVNASGAVTTGSWSGSTIAVANGGTGATTVLGAQQALDVEPGVDVQAYSAKLQSIVDLSGSFSAGIIQVVGYSNSNTAQFVETTTFGRSLIDDASSSAARTTLGLVIGTDVQAFNSNLSAISGLTSAADKLPYFTGSGTASVADFSSFGRSLVDDADASAARTTLGLGSIATQAANNVSITGGSIDNVVFDGGSF